MLSLAPLILAYIMAISVGHIQTEVPTPSCIYFKEEHLASPSRAEPADGYCHISREQDNCSTSSFFITHETTVSEKFTHLVENNSKSEYINVTIQSDFQTNKYLLLESDGTCWNVHVTGVENPYHIVVFNLPVSSESQLTAATVFKEPDLPSCNFSTCSFLYKSTLAVSPIANRKMVQLTIRLNVDAILRVELMSGECNITCDGSRNSCNVNILYNHNFNLTSKKTEVIGFYNLSSANYCVRIGSNDNCCVVHTETVKLDELTEFSLVIKEKNWMTTIDYSILAVIIIVMILSLVLLYFVKNKLFSVIRMLMSPITEPIEEYTTSLVPELEIKQLIQEMKSKTHVCLVYPYDSQNFFDMITSFRSLLQVFVNKVWDPYSEEDMENVSMNIAVWVETVLSNPNMCIIIIESENAVRIEKLWDDKQQESPCEDRRFLNDIFLYTLSALKNDITLKFDYSRIFIIRLNSTNDYELNLLKGTRYIMPDHFETLIYHVSRRISIKNNIDFQDFSRFILWVEEKENFTRAQLHYISSK